MRSTRYILIIICLFIAVSILTSSPKPDVRVSVVSVVLTNGLPPVLTLSVTNAGRKSVYVGFDSLERKSEGEWKSDRLPLGRPSVFIAYPGAFILSGGSNCIVTVRGPSHSLPWRVHGTLREPATLLQKATFAKHRLWMRIRRGANKTALWPSTLMATIADIWSPTIAPLEKQISLSPIAVHNNSALNAPLVQPHGPANGSQPIRSKTNSTSTAAGFRR